jgi:hypothetical protein
MAYTLKACPTCGPININYVRIHQLGWFFVKCHSCSRTGEPHPSEAGAVAIWNGEEAPPLPLTFAQKIEQRDRALVVVRKLRGTDFMRSKEFLDALDIVLDQFPEKK